MLILGCEALLLLVEANPQVLRLALQDQDMTSLDLEPHAQPEVLLDVCIHIAALVIGGGPLHLELAVAAEGEQLADLLLGELGELDVAERAHR